MTILRVLFTVTLYGLESRTFHQKIFLSEKVPSGTHFKSLQYIRRTLVGNFFFFFFSLKSYTITNTNTFKRVPLWAALRVLYRTVRLWSFPSENVPSRIPLER